MVFYDEKYVDEVCAANIARFLRQNMGQRNQTCLSLLFTSFFHQVSEYMLYNFCISTLSISTKFQVFPSVIQIWDKNTLSVLLLCHFICNRSWLFWLSYMSSLPYIIGINNWLMSDRFRTPVRDAQVKKLGTGECRLSVAYQTSSIYFSGL